METAAQSEGGQLTIIQSLKIAEAYEIGKQSQELVNNGGQLSKLSQHQRIKNNTRQNTRQQDKDKSSKPSCSHCGRSDHTSKLQDRRDNCPAFDKSCNKCKTNGHFGPQCRGGFRNTRDKSTTRDKPTKDNPKVNEVKSQDKDKDKDKDNDKGTLSGSWFLINGKQGTQSGRTMYEDSQEFSSVLRRPKANISSISSKDTIKKLGHHIKDEFGNWKPSHVQPHGNIQVSLQVSQSAAEQLQLQPIQHAQQTFIKALADTGAQMCVADWSVAKQMVPALSVSVADNTSFELIGATFMTITTKEGYTSEQLVYLAHDVGQFYLSKQALFDLHVIPHNFPTVAACDNSGPPLQGKLYEVQGGFPSANQHHVPQGQHVVPHQDSQGYHINPAELLSTQNTVQPTIQDVGPEWHLEHPDFSTGSGTWLTTPPQPQGTVHEVQGGFSSELCPPQPSSRQSQVKFDSKGR